MAFDGPLLSGRFRLGPRLGRGSQADTFVALDEKAQGTAEREVVVKRMIPRGTWTSFELFEREAPVLGQLRHPGLPRFIASFEEPSGTFNLVMQRMPGENLRELTKRRRLSELELRDLLIRSLEILDYMHTRVPPVIHRDIKPSNLIKSPAGAIAVVDFGGVLDAAREKGGSTMVGTFGYMAPEQLHGQVTPATDLYALGATMVALAGGIEPEDVPRKGLRMDLDRHLPSIDPTLRAALQAMTEPDPDARPQRARDVVALLARSPRETARHIDGRRRRAEEAYGIATTGDDASLGRRRMFRDLPEPTASILRLAVLGFGAAGWLAMWTASFAIQVLSRVLMVIAFPLRSRVKLASTEVRHMLSEGQQGFADITKQATARDKPRGLPPGGKA